MNANKWKIVGIILPARLGSMWAPGATSPKAVVAYVTEVLNSDEFWEGVQEARL
jgi:hypothetical protein